MLDCDPEWITKVSGIEERRFASEDEDVPTMGLNAARLALEKAGLAAKDIGFLIASSGSCERRFPGPAAVIARELGLGECPTLDIPIASAGSLFALELANRLAPVYGNILVVGSEKMSAIAMEPPLERGISMLFGDGAGACVVSPEKGEAEIVDTELGSDGSFADDLKLEFGKQISMNGRTVILHATRKMPRAMTAILERRSLTAEAMRVFLLHQANLNLLARIANSMGVDLSKFHANIARFGNTSSASLLIAASEWFSSCKLGKEEYAMMSAFGAGFHWGALLLRGA
jgi:3-oxoacyl-[acyl-carrier-protein] synthase-3